MGVERILRVYFLPQWYALADEALEDALYDSQALRTFAGIDLGSEAVPDATTLLKFRHLLEAHGLTGQHFAEVNAHLAEKGLLRKRRFRPRTTGSRHPCPIAPNRLAARAAPPTRPDEVWLADITYVATRQGWAYLAGVMDACSRRIVGWALAGSMPASVVARAFQHAVTRRRPTPGPLHHSDRGTW